MNSSTGETGLLDDVVQGSGLIEQLLADFDVGARRGPTGSDVSSRERICRQRRINAHAENDGFSPQENPSKTAADTRYTKAGEKSSEAGTEECEDWRYDRLTISRHRPSVQ
jgi:hypothetical protein